MKKSLVGPLVGILVAVIVALAVVIPVTISVIGYSSGVNGTTAFGVNTSAAANTYLGSTVTVVQLFPLLTALLVLVAIAGYMTIGG